MVWMYFIYKRRVVEIIFKLVFYWDFKVIMCKFWCFIIDKLSLRFGFLEEIFGMFFVDN